MRDEMKTNCKLLLTALQIIPLGCILCMFHVIKTSIVCIVFMVGYVFMFMIGISLLKKALDGNESSQKNVESNVLGETTMPFKEDTNLVNASQSYTYHEGHEHNSKFVVESSFINMETPKKVLIVDDSMSHLKLMSSFLKKMNIDASMAQSGNEAIAAVQREKYALILMDHMMKGKNGIETVKEIRQLNGDYFKKVPIVDVLARGMERYEVKVNTDYYQACLTKPIDYELLLQVMITYGLYQIEDAVL